MKAFIRIDSEPAGEKRAVFWNDELSHHISEQEIQDILNLSAKNLWKTDLHNGSQIGSHLYRFLNGTGGKLQSVLRESVQKDDPLYLYLDIPYKLNSLPFELLCNDRFLLLNDHPRTFVVRRVSDRNRRKDEKPEKRPLSVLFTACSPNDLKAHQALRFEKEEELILAATEKFPVHMTIEDSGSLEGIQDALCEGGGEYDILHITGHAGIDQKLGPVVYMEDETGRPDRVTPARLSEAVRDFPPRVLFLSGCSTGKSDKVSESESLAFQMVENGIPIVLGWGLPVSDRGATLLTTVLYKYFGMGKSICEAVNFSRQAMKEHYNPWPLLRLFSDGSPLAPLIAPGQKLRARHPRKTKYKFLSDSHVKVLEKGFVGRRREIQKGVRVLKGMQDEHGAEKYGLLIRGPAGIGKSCLSGKLIERFPDAELIVIHGRLKAVDIIQKLRKMFDRKGVKSGLAVLKADLEYEDRIKALFRAAFREVPVIFCFDDFEQNLERYGDVYQMDARSLPVAAPILQALDWAGGDVRLIISSRYPFDMEYEGENLRHRLGDITLMGFRDADLEKKSAELFNISMSGHRKMYLKFGHGNPRLLEWLDKIAENEDRYDIGVLEKALEGKNEEFVRDYLSDILAKTEGEEFHCFIHQAAVFRQPVDVSAFSYIRKGDENSLGFLEKGVDLTLFEKEHPMGHDAVYWVMPVIREKEWGNLECGEQKKIHGAAYEWYDRKIGENGERKYVYMEEAVYHGLEAGNVRGACGHAVDLGNYMSELLLYRERAQLQQGVADRITDEVVAEATEEKDENVAALLNELGYVYWQLGDYRKAREYYEKALAIDINVFGDNHPNIAIDYNNLGAAYHDLGEARKATEYYEKALAIDINVFGENHPKVAIRYNNLGEACRITGKVHKATEYYEKALAIDINVFGENHPDVAIDYNNLGAAYRALGDAYKATEYYEKALAIDINVFGDNHPSVAIDYNNLAFAWKELGEVRKATEYYEKALLIFTNVYGTEHPHTKIVKKNLKACLNQR
ncbi:MAG: tetratricopeptide repeat protein [Desulfobacterales bacterium]|nr:tetratricopeptide repeat protein [Desulfobacterales bacterium]